MLLIISQIFTWLFFISLLLWWAGICSLTECLLRPVHQEGRSCLCDRFSLIHESNFSHNMRGYFYWNTGSVLAGAWLGTPPPPCLYISIIKHFVLLLLYRNSRPNFDKKKTYQNNTVCLTRVLIYRKRSPILILELIENSPQL